MEKHSPTPAPISKNRKEAESHGGETALRDLFERLEELKVKDLLPLEYYERVLNLAKDKKELERQKKELEIQVEVLQSKIEIDGLTGSLTREGLEKGIMRVLDINRGNIDKYKYIYACMAIDLDKFKDLNTKLAHAGGDLALKIFAHILRGALRDGDQMEIERKPDRPMEGRYGGDEFRCFIPIRIGKVVTAERENKILGDAIKIIKDRLVNAMERVKFSLIEGHVAVTRRNEEETLKEGEFTLGASFEHAWYDLDPNKDNNENLKGIFEAFDKADGRLETIKEAKRGEEIGKKHKDKIGDAIIDN